MKRKRETEETEETVSSINIGNGVKKTVSSINIEQTNQLMFYVDT